MANQELTVIQQTGGAAVVPSVGTVKVSLMETMLMTGDLAKVSAPERLQYYRGVCESIGINPLTRPFDYLALNGKLVLYAKKDCTEQLRSVRNVSVKLGDPKTIEGILYIVAYATLPNGRTDESTGAVSFEGLKGEAKANAFMKCETKAKRRVTLSICGLGFIDDSEVDSIRGARRVSMDQAHSVDFIDVTPEHPTDAKPGAAQTATPKAAPRSQSPTGNGGNSKKGVSETPEVAAAGGGPGNGKKPAAESPLDALVAEFRACKDRFARLKMFQELKRDIIEVTGDDAEYRRVLNRHGVEKSDQFQDLETAKRALVDLYTTLQQHASALAEPAEPAAEPAAEDDKSDWIPEILNGEVVS